MKFHLIHTAAALLSALALTACASTPAETTTTTETHAPIQLEALADGVWMHTSWHDVPGYGLIASNGLVVEGDASVVVIDTAWTPDATEALFDWIDAQIGKPVDAVVITHAHSDRMGGLSVAHRRGAVSYATAATIEDAQMRGLSAINHQLETGTEGLLFLHGVALEIYFPGHAHTRDNIVVYEPRSGVLFGGCLVRAQDTQTLGNTADGSVENWANAADAVRHRFPDAAIVVPGHGDPGDLTLLSHTADLGRAATAH